MLTRDEVTKQYGAGPPMLTLDEAAKQYGAGPPVFEPVSAHLSAATCVAVRGPHGAGKSTLLRMIAGLERPTMGTISIWETEGGEAALRRATSLILPDHGLFPSRTAMENLILSQRLAGHPRAVAIEAAYAMLQRLDLVAVADRFPEALSRSEHRLTCIARAVLRRPRLLVADEPGEGLRPEAAAAARQLLREAVTQGALLIMASTADDPAAPEPAEVITLSRPPKAAAAAC